MQGAYGRGTDRVGTFPELRASSRCALFHVRDLEGQFEVADVKRATARPMPVP